MPVDKIRVMITSRCKDYPLEGGGAFGLARLRESIRAAIDSARVFDETVFECWINENEPAKSATSDLWDECMRAVQRANIVVALYNGDSGWSAEEADDGICHAELTTGLRSGRDRFFLVQLPLTSKPPTVRDRRFRKLVEQEQLFTGTPATSVEDALLQVRHTLAETVARMVRGAAVTLRKDGYALGEALEWSRLSYPDRKAAIEQACVSALSERTGAVRVDGQPTHLGLRIGRDDVLLCVHGVPASMSTAAARELVGRPFLADHRHLAAALKMTGPVHLVACHRTVTEKQATDLLGFPDATVVATTFGIYVVDPVQRIQLALLANCRDQTSARYAVQRLFDWLARSGQGEALGTHAKARARIVRAIQSQVA